MSEEKGTSGPSIRPVDPWSARLLTVTLIGAAAMVAVQIGGRPGTVIAGPLPADTPTDTPTNTPETPTETPTDTPTNTPETPTETPTDTPTNTPETPTETPTNTPTNGPETPTDTPTSTPTNGPETPTDTHTSTATASPSSTPTFTPVPETGEQCSDGIDNDRDGLTDCDDPGCLPSGACPAPTPVTSPIGLLFVVGLFMFVGLWRLHRRLN